LALAEEDKQKADLLYKLADEADQGVLCTADWISALSMKATRRDDPMKPRRRE
jgi:hypothetical protein